MTEGAAPTLVDVAALAGVAVGTASRALSKQGYVSKDASERVLAAAAKLGYIRNELARSLKVRSSRVIGLVVPDIGGPFMTACVRAIQRVTRSHGYTLVITFTDGAEVVEQEEIEYFIRLQVDGILIVPAVSDAAHLHSPGLARVPMVAFDQPISGTDRDAVLIANRQGAAEAVQHLIWHKHRRIACIGMNKQLYSIQERVAGYRQAMKEAKLPEMIALMDAPEDDIGRQIDAWLGSRRPPTAIFSLNEVTTLETVRALSERKLRVPKDLAFVGFDEVQLAAHLNTPLTTVLQPATEIGERAALRLLELLHESGATHKAKRLMLNTTLLVRNSCGCTGSQPRKRATKV